MKSLNPVEKSNKPHLQVQRPTTHHSNLGSELLYKKLQESLSRTGNINHPETIEIEKDYIRTLSIDQMRHYNDMQPGTSVSEGLNNSKNKENVYPNAASGWFLNLLTGEVGWFASSRDAFIFWNIPMLTREEAVIRNLGRNIMITPPNLTTSQKIAVESDRNYFLKGHATDFVYSQFTQEELIINLKGVEYNVNIDLAPYFIELTKQNLINKYYSYKFIKAGEMELDQKAAKLIKKNGYLISSFLAKQVLNKVVNFGRFGGLGGLLSPILVNDKNKTLQGQIDRRTEELFEQYNKKMLPLLKSKEIFTRDKDYTISEKK
ncbi:hypothetical protein LF887_01790 [Chryseobacterium sp. MEBOG06]|uniref:hypothetical protein n=1 Tax=unclassified Chryseobacterium TaxID=2593645 RepID=UPI001F2D28B8|nr:MULTISPECIES: hypothetical protein [unclassified Chryseobacterium]UKB84407.1 hypothetical protein LF887_01790 [Chryseobacterium sp. MEBOG06]